MQRRYIFSIFLFLLVISTLKAEIKMPSVFSDNMILQQHTEALIWGEATPGKTVKIITSWNKKRYTTLSGMDGQWETKIKTPTAGGPYSISISDGEELKLSNILIGEVWVCSGQSNMDMSMKGRRNQPVIDSNEAIAKSTNDYLRLFKVNQNKSLEPLKDFSGQWLECKPENVADFSATAYFFGRMIQQILNVPVGLICASMGGTKIEPWTSENGLKNINWEIMSEKSQEIDFSKQTPTVLFNAMIQPMVGYALKGVLWYQGEANRKDPEHYGIQLKNMVEDWRNHWEIGEFAFYYAQIAPFDYGEINVNSAFLREAQLKASNTISNSGMACLMDIGEENCVHPANKKVTGERLAFLALAKTYNQKGIAYSGPVLKEMKIQDDKILLTFNHAENGLTTFGAKLENFKVAGENRRFFPANASITGEGILLYSNSVKEPVAVRYAFDDFVSGELFNTEGLPASSFRTDDW